VRSEENNFCLRGKKGQRKRERELSFVAVLCAAWDMEMGAAALEMELVAALEVQGRVGFVYSSFSSSASFGMMVSVASFSSRRISIFVSLPITSSVSIAGRS
jgi:hypothetical protein